MYIVSVSVRAVSVNHIFGIVTVTAKTKNAGLVAVLVTTVTDKSGFG